MSDGARASTSGVDAASMRIRWGDGKGSRGRRTAAHRYGGVGPYTVTVRATDRAGNRVTVRRRISL